MNKMLRSHFPILLLSLPEYEVWSLGQGMSLIRSLSLISKGLSSIEAPPSLSCLSFYHYIRIEDTSIEFSRGHYH